MNPISPINREIIDGKFYWQIIQTKAIRKDGELIIVPCWQSLFHLSNPGVTQPCEYVGSYKEQFTNTGREQWDVWLACHEGGDSRTASYQSEDKAREAVERYAKGLGK